MGRWLALLLTGCFAYEAPTGVPCPDGVCPTGQVCSVRLTCEARFEIDAQLPDMPPPPPIDAPSFTFTRLPIADDTHDDADPTLTGDMLEIIWSSTRPGGQGDYDLWHSTRADHSSAWSAPSPLTNLNGTKGEQSPELSRDGLELFFSSTRDGNHDIFRATRANRSDPFGNLTKVTELSTGDDHNLAVSGLVAIVDSQESGTPDRDLYMTTRPSIGAAWTPLVHLDGVDTAAQDGSPFLSDDHHHLYFHRFAPYQMYVATASLGDLSFTNIQPLFDEGDSDPWVSPDEDTIVFGRAGDIYMATR